LAWILWKTVIRFWKAVTRSSVRMYWSWGGRVWSSVLKVSITIFWSFLRSWDDRDFSIFVSPCGYGCVVGFCI